MSKKNWLYVFVCFIVGGVLGYFGNWVTRSGFRFSIETLIPISSYLASGLSVLALIIAYYFQRKSRTLNKQYHQSEDDDEASELLYRSTFRSLEYGIIAFNTMAVGAYLGIFIFISGNLDFLLSAPLHIILYFTTLVLLAVGQAYTYKSIELVRQYKIPYLATPKDALNYVNSYDEGERQANLEQSFLILFRLSQMVLPILYVLITVCSLLMGQVQLLTFLVLAFIHLYINLAQLPMIKKYFK